MRKRVRKPVGYGYLWFGIVPVVRRYRSKTTLILEGGRGAVSGRGPSKWPISSGAGTALPSQNSPNQYILSGLSRWLI